MQFAEVITQGIAKLYAFTLEKANDGDYSLEELKQTKGELEVVTSAIDYWIEKIEEAVGCATSHSADKNNSEKV